MAKNNGELFNTLINLLNRIKEDWYKNPYNDKYVSYYNKYNNEDAKHIDYNFENGEKVRFIVLEPNLSNNEYVFEVKIYKEKIGIKSKKKKLYDDVKHLLVNITNDSIKRPIIKNEKKQDRLLLLNRLIVLKQSNIESMLGTEPNYFTLVNELNAYKKMAEKLSQ